MASDTSIRLKCQNTMKNCKHNVFQVDGGYIIEFIQYPVLTVIIEIRIIIQQDL